MKAPAFQFYPADWRKDPGVQALDFFSRGVWIEILCLMHESNERGVLLLNGAAMPEAALANILGLDKQNFDDALTKIKAYGVAKVRQSDGALYSKRMVDDERLTQIRRDAGNKGGNPVLLKQNTTTQDKQIPTPSSSSSSSSSKKEKTCSANRGTRLPSDWNPTDEQIAWAKKKRPDVDPLAEAENFRDFWIAKAGSGGVKLDWFATWRTWIRRATGNPRQQTAPRAPQAQRPVVVHQRTVAEGVDARVGGMIGDLAKRLGTHG